MHEMSALYFIISSMLHESAVQVCVHGAPTSKDIPIHIENGCSCKKVHLKTLIKFKCWASWLFVTLMICSEVSVQKILK